MQADLFEAHKPLAFKLAQRYARRESVPYSDLPAYQNAALVGLWQASERWLVNKGASFVTVAYKRIDGEIRDEARRIKGRKPRRNTPLDRDFECRSNEAAFVLKDSANKLISKVSAGRTRGIAVMWFLEERSITEIQDKYKIKESMTRRLIRRALCEMGA